MLLLILNVIYVLIAITMVALILMQRGAGAQAGSGFGGGASATVFGARGSSNFLSKTTKWLAVLFFAISLYMAWQASRGAAGGPAPASQDVGLAADIANTPAKPAPAPAAGSTIPSAPARTVPAAPASTVPSAPASTAPQAPAASGTTVPAAPAPQQTPPQSQPASGG